MVRTGLQAHQRCQFKYKPRTLAALSTTELSATLINTQRFWLFIFCADHQIENCTIFGMISSSGFTPVTDICIPRYFPSVAPSEPNPLIWYGANWSPGPPTVPDSTTRALLAITDCCVIIHWGSPGYYWSPRPPTVPVPIKGTGCWIPTHWRCPALP